MDELKSCPFCGGKIEERGGQCNYGKKTMTLDLKCKQCETIFKFKSKWNENPYQEAVAAFNRRTNVNENTTLMQETMLKPKVVPKVISAIPKPCGGRVRAKDQMAIMRVFLTPLLVWKKIIWHFFIIASEVMILPKRISPIGLNLWTENTPNPSVFTK